MAKIDHVTPDLKFGAFLPVESQVNESKNLFAYLIASSNGVSGRSPRPSVIQETPIVAVFVTLPFVTETVTVALPSVFNVIVFDVPVVADNVATDVLSIDQLTVGFEPKLYGVALIVNVSLAWPSTFLEVKSIIDQ